jgi:hypothetical protein
MKEKLYIYNQQSRLKPAVRLDYPWLVIHAGDYRGPEKMHSAANPAYRRGHSGLARFRTLGEAVDFAVALSEPAGHEVP